jgi:hypothetical protein
MNSFLILRSVAKRCVSKDEFMASWFETRKDALLTMRRAVRYEGRR